MAPRNSKYRGLAEKKSGYSTPRTARRPRDRGRPKLPPPTVLTDGTIRFFATLGPKGRVLLPAEMRAAMGLAQGDVVIAWLKDGELRLESHRRHLRHIQQQGRRLAGDRSVVDEFISERREAAARGE